MATSTVRALKTIKLMQGKTFSGITVTELAKAAGTNSTNICRTLDDLVAEGFAEKREDGRYQLSISLLRIATSFQQETQRLQSRIGEYQQRISVNY